MLQISFRGYIYLAVCKYQQKFGCFDMFPREQCQIRITMVCFRIPYTHKLQVLNHNIISMDMVYSFISTREHSCISSYPFDTSMSTQSIRVLCLMGVSLIGPGNACSRIEMRRTRMLQIHLKCPTLDLDSWCLRFGINRVPHSDKGLLSTSLKFCGGRHFVYIPPTLLL